MNEILPQILAFILAGVIFGIPVLAFSLRFALKPLVEAYTRLKEAQSGDDGRQLPVVMQQLAVLEQRLQAIEEHVDRLDEVAEFHRELEKPRS
jgi:pilus assembly protein TadC